jgi:hypothetical protein
VKAPVEKAIRPGDLGIGVDVALTAARKKGVCDPFFGLIRRRPAPAA